MGAGHPHTHPHPEHKCKVDTSYKTFLKDAAPLEALLLLYNQRLFSAELQGAGPGRALLLFHKPSEQKLKCHQPPRRETEITSQLLAPT